MTPTEALKIIELVTANVRLTRAEHARVIEAIDTLEAACIATPKPEETTAP